MKSSFLCKGLVIVRRTAHLEYVTRSAGSIYFRDLVSCELCALTELQFWEEFNSRAIKVVEAFSSATSLVYDENDVAPADATEMPVVGMPEKWQADVDRKGLYIAGIRQRWITRGQRTQLKTALEEIAKEISDPMGPPAPSTFGKWMRKYELSGFDIASVSSGFVNRSRRKSTGRVHEQIIQCSIQDHYLVLGRPSFRSAHLRYVNEIKKENRNRVGENIKQLQPISYRTYVRRVGDLSKYDVVEARYGAEYARHRFNMIEGHLPGDHPLDYVEIDHSPVNLYVIDDHANLPLGRPWITVIKDRYSGVVLGLFVSFSPPSLQSTFGAIKHSLQSHEAVMRRWPEIENAWPSFGLGQTYVSDRGSDFLALMYRVAIRELGAEYQYCERHTPWHKGSIERFFGTFETTLLELLPGRTFRSLSERGDYDSKLHAVVRFSAFVYLLHKWVADFHNIFPNQRKQARPIDLWNDGIVVAPPALPHNLDALDIILGETHTGRLSHEGVRFKWMTFADHYLHDLMKEVGPGTIVQYVVSQDNVGYINVLDPRDKRYIAVPNTRPDYADGLSLFQHQYIRRITGQALDKKNPIDHLIRARESIQNSIGDELLSKRGASKAHLARIAQIDSNAVIRGEDRSVWTPFKKDAASISEAPSFAAPITDVSELTWRVR
ncbi:transposase [Paraburkholderia sp. SIMBA_053]|uniref:transposase n=1 Tax=Paraburkholderia sp. SIMBA_053 TaxID=3085794 RepID=UPI0039799386